MRQILQRIATSARWFVGALIFVLFIVLFLWRLIDREGFTEEINGFMKDIATVFQYLLTLTLICSVVAYFLGWRPWGRRNNNRGGGH